MNIFWIMSMVTAFVVTVFALRAAIFLRRCPVLRPTDAVPPDAPLISIILPARNEAAHIERCVRSLLAQSYPQLEVIVVDDGSSDATPAILARLAASDDRLRVVRGGPLPRGWTGKNHAIAVGMQHVRGAWLLFVDADVSLHPSALSAAYLAARAHGAAMLSLWAYQELGSFWERVAQPVIVGMSHAIDPFQRTSNRRYPNAAFANGKFILAERSAYEHVGGHAAVREEVLEDQVLSGRFKHAGYHMLMLDGTQVLSTRMYTSLAGIWEGWSKNNFLTLQRSFLMLFGSVVAVYVITISPFLMVLWALIEFKFSQQVFDPLVINLVAILVLLVTRWRARYYFDTPLRYYLWHPIGGLIFIGIFLNSAYQHTWGHGVTWKGRRYGDVDPIG